VYLTNEKALDSDFSSYKKVHTIVGSYPAIGLWYTVYFYVPEAYQYVVVRRETTEGESYLEITEFEVLTLEIVFNNK